MNRRDKTRIAKVCLLGNVGVGKSSIVRRFTLDEFREDEMTTVGAAFTDKTIQHQDNVYKFQIWDTAGQEKYAPLTHMYYRDAHVALLVYDITDPASFERAKSWARVLKDEGSKGVIVVIVGNKYDLAEKRRVEEEDVKAFANEVKGLYAFTSAKDNTGIIQMFYSICERLEQDTFKDLPAPKVSNNTDSQQNIQLSPGKTTSDGDSKSNQKGKDQSCC